MIINPSIETIEIGVNCPFTHTNKPINTHHIVSVNKTNYPYNTCGAVIQFETTKGIIEWVYRNSITTRDNDYNKILSLNETNLTNNQAN